MATGREIKQIYDAMRKICEETSRLISTVNDKLVDKGFKPVGDNGVMWDTSVSYLNPRKWLPFFQQRVFIKEKDPRKGVGINIVFDGSLYDLMNNMPFISCGLLLSAPGEKVKKSDEFYDAGWKNCEKIEDSVLYQSVFQGFEKILNYFLPLDELTGPQKATELIIEPLLALYDGRENEVNEMVKNSVIGVRDITGIIS